MSLDSHLAKWHLRRGVVAAVLRCPLLPLHGRMAPPWAAEAHTWPSRRVSARGHALSARLFRVAEEVDLTAVGVSDRGGDVPLVAPHLFDLARLPLGRPGREIEPAGAG